jgi:hypothetical protein
MVKEGDSGIEKDENGDVVVVFALSRGKTVRSTAVGDNDHMIGGTSG